LEQVYFELMHSRLVDYLRSRVKSGELTERGLARIAGISQPHLHNVLKGVRVLSTAKADAVVMNLRLCALDLVREDELAGSGRTPASTRQREVPLAAGCVGPGHPFPDLQKTVGRMSFFAEELEGIACPVAVRLAADPAAAAIFHAGDIVLLDVLQSRGEPLQPGYHAIEESEQGVLRWCENEPADPGRVVRARAIWVGHYLQSASK
jgi:hypothetical protein